jgi:SAM-dependent methyltransferase
MNVTVSDNASAVPIGEPVRVAAHVDRHFARRGRGPEFDMEVRWIRRHVPEDLSRWADVGCGNGALIRAIGRGRPIGIDYAAIGLAPTTPRSPNARFVCADAANLPLAERSLIAITSQHLIEHLPDAERACREWHRVLEPGGLLIIQTPNAAFCDPGVFDDPSHVRLFDRRTLGRIVRDAGFTVVDLRTLGLPWFRDHRRFPGGWRFRRLVTAHAERLSACPGCRWSGQTLCCLARKPVRS